MLEPLQTIVEEPWKPLSRPALVGWLIFYAAFLIYAFSAQGGFLFIDNANLIVHEGGHNLFGGLGPRPGFGGGPLRQWLSPFRRAPYFFPNARGTDLASCWFSFSKTGFTP